MPTRLLPGARAPRPAEALTPDPSAEPVLLATVAIEPNRWSTVDESGDPTTRVSEWLDAIASAGFDGTEIWERHLTSADPAEADGILGHPLPITVFNSYVAFDEADDARRREVAGWVARSGAGAVKCNVGDDPLLEAAYGDRLAAWLDHLPDGTRLLCECHDGISIAEDPVVAGRILERAGPPSRAQAIVHTHDSDELTRSRFDAYGDRITHVHVNHLDLPPGPPPLHEVAERLEPRIGLLRDLGFRGSWSIEFVAGTLTDQDQPALLVEQAAADLRVLRELLG
ncbi:MAG: hypothetical protein AAGK32_08445 [Actinomycetota bacterium]